MNGGEGEVYRSPLPPYYYYATTTTNTTTTTTLLPSLCSSSSFINFFLFFLLLETETLFCLGEDGWVVLREMGLDGWEGLTEWARVGCAGSFCMGGREGLEIRGSRMGAGGMKKGIDLMGCVLCVNLL